MKLLLDIPPDLIQRVNEVLGQSGANNLSQFVQLALQNQLALEAAPTGPFDRNVGLATTRTPSPPSAPTPWTGALQVSAIPWARLTAKPAQIHRDQPLWGQYNRILPAKFGGRILAVIQAAANGGVPLATFHKTANDIAVRVRTDLEGLDKTQGLQRGERRSAAFPDDTELSRRRFAEQFLGSVQSNGQVTGLLPELGLIAIERDKERTVRLTQEGLSFLRLPNPVIDEGGHTPDSLSDQESRVLLSHIRQKLQPEYQFLVQLLHWIQEGANVPEDLFNRVLQKWPAWGEKKGQTMRNGAMGRMHDLGLIGRERNGLRVTYHLKPRATELIANGA